jgi:hypothetical protein
MNRREFIRNTSLAASTLALEPSINRAAETLRMKGKNGIHSSCRIAN